MKNRRQRRESPVSFRSFRFPKGDASIGDEFRPSPHVSANPVVRDPRSQLIFEAAPPSSALRLSTNHLRSTCALCEANQAAPKCALGTQLSCGGWFSSSAQPFRTAGPDFETTPLQDEHQGGCGRCMVAAGRRLVTRPSHVPTGQVRLNSI